MKYLFQRFSSQNKERSKPSRTQTADSKIKSRAWGRVGDHNWDPRACTCEHYFVCKLRATPVASFEQVFMRPKAIKRHCISITLIMHDYENRCWKTVAGHRPPYVGEVWGYILGIRDSSKLKAQSDEQTSVLGRASI